MHPTRIAMATLLCGLTMASQAHGQDKTPVLKGPYLGQTPPGQNAEVFAPGIVSLPNWGDAGSFSPDMTEFNVTRWRMNGEQSERQVVTFKKIEDAWHAEAKPDSTRAPFIAPDGNTQYFGKRYTERMKDGWSELKSLGTAFDDIRIMGLTASLNGTLVFDEFTRDGKGILRYSRLVDGQREAPTPFGKEINTGQWNAHPFIAPDESYIMWDGSRESGFGSSDLYISFRHPDGSWSEAINLGDKVNTEAEEGGPKITPDGKYLFFNRMVKPQDGGEPQSDLFWIDAQFIEELRPAPEATAAELEMDFRDVAYLDQAFLDATPTDHQDAIAVGELGVDGGNKALIVNLAHEIAEGKHGKFDSLLISQKGKLLFESYYLRGRINLPHPQASATKAYTSLAVGRAIQLGYLTLADLDKPVIDFLKELDRSTLTPGAEKVTLHQAMTMQSGVTLTDEQREAIREEPELLKGQGQVQVYLEQSAPISEASQVFEYKFDPIFVMQVLNAVVPGGAERFIKTELLDKLGISNYRWRTDVSGLPRAGSSSSMTSRAMVKVGNLVENDGVWNGERLIPSNFLAKATDRLLLTGDEEVYFGGEDTSKQGYGYYWWTVDMKVGDKRYPALSAQGGWGQLIVLISELDLMVVITGHDNDAAYQQVIAERILPAFID